MSRSDLPAMIENIPLGRDQHLREMQSRHVDLAVAHRDIDAIITSGGTDLAHLLGIRREGVLAVRFKERQSLLIVDLPHPVGVARDPF